MLDKKVCGILIVNGCECGNVIFNDYKIEECEDLICGDNIIYYNIYLYNDGKMCYFAEFKKYVDVIGKLIYVDSFK